MSEKVHHDVGYPSGNTVPSEVQQNAGATPTAPPLSAMDQIEGYHDIGFSAAVLPPPRYEDVVTERPADRTGFTRSDFLTDEEARQALLQFVGQHCCYGSAAARQMNIVELKPSSAFHYNLETFTESRSTAWAYAPYEGQAVDTPANGPAPMPWDVKASPPNLFADTTTHIEVPHTASVKPCHECVGIGRTRCEHCNGNGRTMCHSCHGSGNNPHYNPDVDNHRRCAHCHGNGRKPCYRCNGEGQIKCGTCKGRGQLKCYVKLTVTWKNHVDDHVVDRVALPPEMIRNVHGDIAFQEEEPRVWAVSNFPQAEINQASKNLVERHSSQFKDARILRQRHRVRIVPVTEVTWTWKTQSGQFVVFGFERCVYAPDYPQTCCCGCTIL